ncbi:MAG: SDR family oxidoreductase [Candidatus Heimdallarchaeota archaeon]|nr:SDR family oxidoreductase [Candidatus Heimdallarchaeota archaeon]
MTAKHLLAEGANVVLHFNSNQSAFDGLVSEVDGHRYLICQADLRKEQDVKKMFADSVKKFTTLDGLVNNAGVWPPVDTPIEVMSLNQWNNTFATNLTSVFLCVREFMKNLRTSPSPNPSIIFIGSTAGVFGEAGHVDYSATKAAMKGMVLTLKNEITKISKSGRVNLINPGWTVTEMAEKGLEDTQKVTKILQTIPLRKVARPNDIAKAIVFLLSEKLSGHISGLSLDVTGGMEGRVLFNPDEIDLGSI